MNPSVQILLTPPERLQEALAASLPLAHMAYKIGPDGHLRQSPFPTPPPQGGLLLAAWEGPDRGDPRVPVLELVSVCAKQGFRGVILDLEQSPTPYLSRFLTLAEEALTQRGWVLYLPEAYGRYSNRAYLYFSSALSGGSLSHRLEALAEQYGKDRLVLSLRRSAEDFFLPAPTGAGKPLTQDELHSKLLRLEPSVFFSQALCARYFTYMSRETGAHFVLFDDRFTLEKKRALAEKLGIRRFFLLYPELADLLFTGQPQPV